VPYCDSFGNACAPFVKPILYASPVDNQLRSSTISSVQASAAFAALLHAMRASAPLVLQILGDLELRERPIRDHDCVVFDPEEPDLDRQITLESKMSVGSFLELIADHAEQIRIIQTGGASSAAVHPGVPDSSAPPGQRRSTDVRTPRLRLG
jgi:hypothetical protein